MAKKSLILLAMILCLFDTEIAMAFSLVSSAFKAGEQIPAIYGCTGKDLSPPLSWQDPPSATQSFVLLLEDYDAPGGIWDHWIVFNIPKNITQLKENDTLPPEAVLGTNSWNRIQYNGPCPPQGKHRYFFKLYALDTVLNLQKGVNKQSVKKAMENHVLGQAELMAIAIKK